MQSHLAGCTSAPKWLSPTGRSQWPLTAGQLLAGLSGFDDWKLGVCPDSWRPGPAKPLSCAPDVGSRGLAGYCPVAAVDGLPLVFEEFSVERQLDSVAVGIGDSA
jgi:hypothetical protein